MTMNKKKQMTIGALIHANGSHSASWLLQEAHPHASTDIDYYRGIAQLAERGKFDFFFIADTPAARTENLRGWSRSRSCPRSQVRPPISALARRHRPAFSSLITSPGSLPRWITSHMGGRPGMW